MSGPLRNRPLNMGLKPITGLADAVEDEDAVNKGQMDTAIAGKADTDHTHETMSTDFISGLIPAPTNKDYKLIVKMPYAATITETTTVSASGTCTATFKINSTALGGTANSVSSSETSQAHASANVTAAGDDIVLTISSNSTCVDLSFCIKFTRALG